MLPIKGQHLQSSPHPDGKLNSSDHFCQTGEQAFVCEERAPVRTGWHPRSDPEDHHPNREDETFRQYKFHGDSRKQEQGGRLIFPPLWGAHSFNCGAGLHLVAKAASFIQHNMPLGNSGILSVQEAWDVARYIESRPHPLDPRKSVVQGH